MFLKSIEIRGFKSFSDKTELGFKKGITAVVGPNGSGKSNISDAVRWVLGEQSVKSLRGGKMEDVIFAGTQFRKPVGLAQVSLTLDNSDSELPIEYSDVTISRRLYRSGESEYYINNTQCRLKDIQELFMDTGIGKEGYSLIGQGKIDAILSGRPEERRSLLEEAAGIVKYKSRKEEAEKRLENTNQNLIRISDILRTYEERLEPLRIDSEKAKTFLELSGELKVKEANLIVHSIDSLQSRIEDIKSKLKNNEEEVEGLLKQREECVKEGQYLQESLDKLEFKLKTKQEEYYKHKSEHQAVNSETDILNERLKNLHGNIEKNSKEIFNIEGKIRNIENSKEAQETDLKQFQEEQLTLNSEITLLEKDLVENNSLFSKKEAFINKLKESKTAIANQINNFSNNIILIKNEQSILEEKLQELQALSENYVSSLKINASTKAALETSIEDLKTNIKGFEEDIRRNKMEITRLNSYVSGDEKHLKELNIKLNKLDANHQMLINLEKQYEGYNKAVKILMQNIDSGKIPAAKSKCFVLGEVITTPKHLEIAMETALGGAISDVITSDEGIAKFLINYLKSNNLGRATFLPLNIVKGKSINNLEQIKKLTGFVGIASALIGYEEKFRNAIEYILGRTIIASDLDKGLEIAKNTGYTFKIVTLSGEVINPGGSLTGGSTYHKSTNIISRKREIEELTSSLEQTNEEISELIKKLDANKSEVKKLDDICLNLRDEIYSNNIEITKLSGKVSAIVSDNDRIAQNLKNSTNETQELKNKNAVSLEKLSDQEASLNKASAQETQILDEINKLDLDIREVMGSIDSLRERHVSLKIKKAQIDEIVVSRVKELARFDSEADELAKRKSLLVLDTLKCENDIKAIDDNIALNKERLKEIEVLLLDFEAIFKEIEVERIKIKEAIKLSSDNQNRFSLILGKKEEELHKQEVILAKLEVEKDSLYTKLNEEMCLTYAEALEHKEVIDSMEEYKRLISRFKNEISALGTVYVGAIEEYKEVKEKYSFMNSQKEDLLKAKDELMEMIHDMTLKMKSVFSENLNILRGLFKETFIELFKGGNADLIIGDGDELTANIEINVEPPGKKLQNINLMSGGEKVLSAIALLFAILKMKPTPFCILDEIEAALDDANVLRYAEFLKKFSNNIQFIVITHRKGTMGVSDVLYGVTMEEKGISKVVSVDLEKQALLK